MYNSGSTILSAKLTSFKMPFRAADSFTRKFEFPAAGVAVVLRPEVPDGVVSQVGRSKDHIVRPEEVVHTPAWFRTRTNSLTAAWVL